MVDDWLVAVVWIFAFLLAILAHKLGHLLLTTPDVEFSLVKDSLKKRRKLSSSFAIFVAFVCRPYALNEKKSLSLNKRFRMLAVGALANAVLLILAMTILALTGTPAVTDKTNNYRDAEVVYDELRLTSTPVVKGANELFKSTTQIKTIQTEHIRGSEHFEELLTHFKDREVLLELTNGDASARQNVTLDDETRDSIKVSKATVTSYTSSAPVVGLTTSADLLYSKVAQSLDAVVGTNIDTNEQSISLRLNAYKPGSLERIGITAAIASIIIPFAYVALIFTSVVVNFVRSSTYGKKAEGEAKQLLRSLGRFISGIASNSVKTKKSKKQKRPSRKRSK